MAKVQRPCEQCGAQFETTEWRLADGRGRFCSKACQYTARKRSVIRTCEVCGKTFIVWQSLVDKGFGRFCSYACKGIGLRKRVARVCTYCGKEFETWPCIVEGGGAKYCSKECQHLGDRKRVRLTCEVCRVTFELRPFAVQDRRFCSTACRDEWFVAYTHGRSQRVKTRCEVCGAEFEAYPTALAKGHQRFCSMACYGKWTAEHRSGERATRWKGGGTPCNCQMCGKQFYVKTSHLPKGEGKFCSRKCMGRWTSLYKSGENNQNWRNGSQPAHCEYCGVEFRVKTYLIERGQGRFCSPSCSGLWASGPNSPAWLGGKSFESYPVTFNARFKRLIRERDNHLCALCGVTDARCVHHINYVKDDTIPANCITLCTSCHGRTNWRRLYWQALFTEIMQLRGWARANAEQRRTQHIELAA
jgi:hypothetical protein